MSDILDENISFSGLKSAYVAGGGTGGDGNSSLRDDQSNTEISLSFFRNADLSDGTSIPSSGDELSIKDDFKGKTFGNKIITTDKFRAYTDWSTNTSYLKGIDTPLAGQSNTGSSDTTNKTIQLITPQNSIYSTILISPNSSSSDTPGFSVDRSGSTIDEATLWINLRSLNPGASYGIIPLDTSMTGSTTTDKWNNQKSYIYNKSGNYHDRLAYNGGHFNFSGSRDDILSTTSIIQPNYRSGTYGSSLSENFHNIIGVTAGTMGSANPGSLNINYWFYTNTFNNFTSYNTQGVNLGFKVKWYETTLQCSLQKDSDIIQPVSPPSTWSSLSDIFSGMYVYGTGIESNDGPFIGEIHTNYMRLYKGKGVSQLTSSLATSDQTNVTLTISGYLYWVLATSSDYTESPKILGPPHTVLPKYQATGSNLSTISEVEEWAFFVGDSTNNSTNYFQFDIRNEEPGGNALSYSVSYSSGTVPTVTNKIEIKYHRYGSTFNDSWTANPNGTNITIEDGTFLAYFWKASDNSLTKLGRIVNQTHTSTTSSYNTVTYDISQPEGTSGYLLLILYGWNYFRADMAIGKTRQLYDDNSEKTILYQDSTSTTTSLNGNAWKTTSFGRKLPSVASFNSVNITDLEDEIAQESISNSFSQSLLTGTSTTGGWQQDKSGTPSSSTGPSRSSDGSSSKYYIFVETSSMSGTTYLATAALRVPITIESGSGL